MGRVIPINNLAQGIQNDNPQPGTMREIVNLLPWRGSLRRRGKTTQDDSFTMSGTYTSTLETGDACYAPNLRLGAKTLFGHRIELTGPSYATRMFVDGDSTKLNDSAPITRMFEAGPELVILSDYLTDSGGYVTVYNGGPSSWGALSGSVTVTAGSTHVSFTVSGMATTVASVGYLWVNGNVYYEVEKALSATTLKLVRPAHASYTGTNYNAYSIATYRISNSPSGGQLFGQANAGSVGQATLTNHVRAAAGCYHQGRVFFGNIGEYAYSGTGGALTAYPARIRWSALSDEQDSNYFTGNRNFNADAVLDLEDGGGPIMGMVSLNGALVILRTFSIQTITGAFASDGTDLGASVNTVARSVGSGGFHSWESFEGGIAFADAKGVYVWDGSKVTNLTRGAIERVYRDTVGANADRVIVTCPGNRIMVWVDSAPAATRAFVFDLVVGGWFRVELDGPYQRIVDTGTQYLSMQNAVYSGSLRTYDLRGVFEDLGSGEADQLQDAEAPITAYVLTNPIPLVDGWQQARITHVGINDGGLFNPDGDPANVWYRLRLVRGPIYADDDYSGDSDLATQTLNGAQADVPKNETSAVTQRTVLVRVDGAEDSTHAMLELDIGAADTGTFTYALNSLGLVVEDNPNFQSA